MKNKTITIIIEEEKYFHFNYFKFIADKISVSKKNAKKFCQKRVIQFLNDSPLQFLKDSQLLSIKKYIQKRVPISIFFLPCLHEIFHFLLEST